MREELALITDDGVIFGREAVIDHFVRATITSCRVFVIAQARALDQVGQLWRTARAANQLFLHRYND